MTSLKEKSKYLLDRAFAIVTWFEDRLFVRERAADRGVKSKRDVETNKTISILKRVLFASIGVSVLMSFTSVFYYFATTPNRIENSPGVVNLAKNGFPAKLAFGSFNDCDANVATCWISNKFDDAGWTSVLLPRFDIKKQSGYEQIVDSGWAVYRMKLEVPESTKAQNGVVAFSPGYVNHRYFEVFLNERLVYVGNGLTGTNHALLLIQLHEKDLELPFSSVVIKAKLERSDLGISHLTGVYVGPKLALDDLYISAERTIITYYLLFVFGKGSIFIILTLFYLYTRAHRGYFHFLGYAFFVTVEHIFFLAGDFMDVNLRVLLFFISKTIAIHALQRFFVDFFQINRASKILNYLGLVTIGSTAILAFDQGWGLQIVKIPHLFTFTNLLLIVTIAVAVAISLIRMRLLRRLSLVNEIYRTLRSISIFLAIYGTLLVWIEFFNVYKGFDMRAILDLCFFFYMTLISVRNFGFNEGKVVTLEAHMEEKRRMELELQEAAEIAKAFMPSEVPVWDFCEIAVFHKSLTESSGDWFAFEKGTERLLYHVMLCDVTGHGVQAALVVSTCKTALSSLVDFNPAVLNSEEFLLHYSASLNKTLYRHGEGHHMLTMSGITFDPENGRIFYISASHPPAFWIRSSKDGSRPKPLVSRHSNLGLHPEFKGKLECQEFDSGDEVVLYTDGIPLLHNAKFLAKISRSDNRSFSSAPKNLYDTVWGEYKAKTNKEPDDDVSIIWFKAVA